MEHSGYYTGTGIDFVNGQFNECLVDRVDDGITLIMSISSVNNTIIYFRDNIAL